MEEIKNGIISEEALDEIAGGLKLPKLTVKKVLTGAGVFIGALAALGGAAGLGYGGYKYKKNKKTRTPAPLAIEWRREEVEAPAVEKPGTQEI